MAEAFLYIWKNIVSGKKYVGVHKGDPDDGYIASSKLFLQDYVVAPHLFERSIWEEGSYRDMLVEEMRFLTSVYARENPEYYNQHEGNGDFYNKGHTEETKKKMRGPRTNTENMKGRCGVHMRGRTLSESTIEKRRATVKKLKAAGIRPQHRKSNTPESNNKRSATLKKKYATGERKSWNKGKTGVQDYSNRLTQPKNLITGRFIER